MNRFKSENMRALRSQIVTQKQNGSTLREIAEAYLPYCDDVSDVNVLLNKVKNQWDAYTKAMRAAIGVEDDASAAMSETQETELQENKDVCMKKDGSRESSLNIAESKLPGDIDSYTPEKLLELHGFVPVSNWTLTSYRSSKWKAQAAEGKVIDMVASKISVVPSTAANFDEDFEKIFLKANKVWKSIGKGISKSKPSASRTGDHIKVLPLADFHLDKREANNSCMSFEKQRQRFYAIIDWFAEKVKEDPETSQIIFFWSQDFFNYDYLTEETTSRRNKQDSSVGYNQMVMEGNRMLYNAIEKLKELAPVNLFYTRSNHDQHTAFNTMCSLYLGFKNDENVIIDGLTAEERNQVWDKINKESIAGIPTNYDAMFDSAPRSYFKWGECLFGFGHGDKEGQRIYNLMQTEANNQFCRSYAKKKGLTYNGNPNTLPDFPEKFAWDKTFIHVFFCGHFHSKQVKSKDDAGVEVIYCGTEMSGDAWHEDCGYIGAQRRIECYTYTKQGDYFVDAIQSRKDY